MGYKCPECTDGYMIVKPGKDRGLYFYGCTNFRKTPSCRELLQKLKSIRIVDLRERSASL